MKNEPKMKVFDFGAFQIKMHLSHAFSHAFWGISYYPAWYETRHQEFEIQILNLTGRNFPTRRVNHVCTVLYKRFQY